MNRTGTRFFSSHAAAWQKADSYINRLILGRSFVPNKLTIQDDSPSVQADLRGRVKCLYAEHLYGQSTEGIGNFIEVVLDIQTGRLVAYNARAEYTYVEPELNFSANQAIERAKSVLAVHAPTADVSNPTVKRQWIHPTPDFGAPRGALLQSQKKLVNGYSVKFKRHVVLISGKTGECLGGGALK